MTMATEGWYAHIALGNVSKSAPPIPLLQKEGCGNKGKKAKGKRSTHETIITTMSFRTYIVAT